MCVVQLNQSMAETASKSHSNGNPLHYDLSRIGSDDSWRIVWTAEYCRRGSTVREDVFPEDLVDLVDRHALAPVYSFLTEADQLN